MSFKLCNPEFENVFLLANLLSFTLSVQNIFVVPGMGQALMLPIGEREILCTVQHDLKSLSKNMTPEKYLFFTSKDKTKVKL